MVNEKLMALGRRVAETARERDLSRHGAIRVVAQLLKDSEREALIFYALRECESIWIREGQGNEEVAGQTSTHNHESRARSFSFSALASHPLEVLVPTFDGTGKRVRLGDLPREAAAFRGNYFAVIRDAYARKAKLWKQVAMKMKDGQTLRDVWDTLPPKLVDFLMEEVGMTPPGESPAEGAS